MGIVCPSWLFLTSQQLSISSIMVSFWGGPRSWEWEAQSYAGSPSSRSGAGDIDWEMPQSLVLSPILFNIYMLSGIIHHYGMRYHQYAHDIQVCIPTLSEVSDAMDALFQCLETVED